MAVSASIHVTGFERVNRLMRDLSPKQNRAIWKQGLTLSAILVQKIAREKKIRRGQPTKGKAHSTRVTSRTGHLRDSIVPEYAKIPRSVSVVSHLPYAGVHEFGGTFIIPSHIRSNENGSWFVTQYAAKFPKRAFLAPALKEALPKLPKLFVKVINREIGASR